MVLSLVSLSALAIILVTSFFSNLSNIMLITKCIPPLKRLITLYNLSSTQHSMRGCACHSLSHRGWKG